MKIKKFKESEIRKAIIKKAKPTINNKRSKHDKGLIFLGSKIVGRVKIPNNHTRVMQPSKSKYIADSLRLDENSFNKFIDCSLKGKEYFSILESQDLS